MILAQAPDTAAATNAIIQVGAVGGVLVLAIIALVVLYRDKNANAKADRAALERAQEQVRQSHADLVEKVMPALANVQQVLTGALEAMREDRRDRR